MVTDASLAALQRNATRGTPGNIKRRLTHARNTERRLQEQLDEHRRGMARLEVELAAAEAREAAEKSGGAA